MSGKIGVDDSLDQELLISQNKNMMIRKNY